MSNKSNLITTQTLTVWARFHFNRHVQMKILVCDLFSSHYRSKIKRGVQKCSKFLQNEPINGFPNAFIFNNNKRTTFLLFFCFVICTDEYSYNINKSHEYGVPSSWLSSQQRLKTFITMRANTELLSLRTNAWQDDCAIASNQDKCTGCYKTATFVNC